MKTKYISYSILLICLCICQSCTNNGSWSNSTTVEADTMPAPAVDEISSNPSNEIKVPLTFDPKTPLTDKLKSANLRELVIQKYYSFENPKNRRKHKPVLYRRVNSDGVIDLTVGGPLSYEEMWELKEKESGHTLSEYFYDAAHIERWTGGVHESLSKDPEFKLVDETSNLAKVFFIDDFEGFVHYNSSYCASIIGNLEQEAADSKAEKIQEHQKMYE